MSALPGLQYDISGLSKKLITLSLNSAEMTGCPSSYEISFLAEQNTLAFVLGDKCDTRCDKICAFFWRLFGRALVVLAVALPSACLLEKELLIANGDEWLGDDTAEVEVAVNWLFLFCFFSHSIFCFVALIFCIFLQSFSLDSFSVSRGGDRIPVIQVLLDLEAIYNQYRQYGSIYKPSWL